MQESKNQTSTRSNRINPEFMKKFFNAIHMNIPTNMHGNVQCTGLVVGNASDRYYLVFESSMFNKPVTITLFECHNLATLKSYVGYTGHGVSLETLYYAFDDYYYNKNSKKLERQK